ncbi:OLC1v1015456C1 [Oldenlandia corymbosa var. corymbosa]|uniref:OLC1v1015456C1 n=1 Tax=Oldenlandia corymbosa var. corymbosa TaxID=529605 RepID=A0AAV1E458_OLDCO|nr:OLC1v1015456C1 [Oldenlandia corymbosa var. corymbosa]
MERSEPALVPEWLRCSGNVAGGSPSSHHCALSSPHADVSSTWSRTSRSNSDIHRAPFLERNHSSNSRRSSSNNSLAKHPYSSFNRNNRDRNREKDKDRPTGGDIWDHDSSDSLESVLTLGADKSSLRRSQSLVSRRSSDVLPHKSEDLRNGINHQNSANGVGLGGSNLSGFQKAAFDKDFPSLGNEDKRGGAGNGRVSSPVLSTAVQSLPIANTGLLGCEKWTSALAEVPSVISNSSIGNSSAQHSVVAPASSVASSPAGNLNMAEALSQVPRRTLASPQAPDKSLRLEELAIKQSRQLIPMTPSTPKTLVSTSSEKSKQPKGPVRLNEVVVPVKISQQQQQNYSSQVSNQPRAGQVRSDASNASHAGKFLVLKSARENLTNSVVKDASNPTNNGNCKVLNNHFPQSPLTPIAGTSNIAPKVFTLEKKAPSLSLNPRQMAEKKASSSLAQSRSDFFNLMRKKSSLSTPSVPHSSCSGLSPRGNKPDENGKETETASVTPFVAEDGNGMIVNDHAWNDAKSFSDSEDKKVCVNGAVFPDEEEAAFLRSLGWEENGEDVEITDEEIVAFYEEVT